MRHDYSYPLRVAADKWPNSPAFVYRDVRWTFRDFDIATDKLAAAFERRGLRGQRVVLLLQNEPSTVMVYLALARAGGVSVPVNPRLLVDEIGFIVCDSGATTIVADDAYADVVRELAAKHDAIEQTFVINAASSWTGGERLETLLDGDEESAAGDVDPAAAAMIVYTSGTSGFPKGVTRTHEANLWATVNAALAQRRGTDDTEMFVLPLFGIAFIFQVMPMILCGGAIVLDGPFDAVRTWELLERHQATRVFLAPTMLDSMLSVDGHESRDVSALRVVNTAYEFPERVRTAAAERFGDIVAYMYGLTEAQLCVSTVSEFAADPSNAGHPMGMMRVRVVDDDHRPAGPGEVGEIAMEGPSLMAGYEGRPEATAEVLADGWLYTGDLGFLDADGRVHVVGRKKAMIKSGGLSVDPVEVENVMMRFEGVREAAVVGVPDEHWGEQVVAFAAPVSGARPSESDLVAYLKSHLAGFKCPKQVWFVSELPKNPMGKVERGRLKAEAVERIQAAS